MDTVPKTSVAKFLRDASEHLGQPLYGLVLREADCKRDYHDHKAAQLLEAIADSLIADSCIEAWMEDLGTNGCDTCS